MDQAQYKAAVNATIRTYRLQGKKFNYNDVLADIELEAIAEAKHKGNGNGSEPERVLCTCAEGIINGRRVAVHRPCDCAYVRERTKLCKAAAMVATIRVGDPLLGDKERWQAGRMRCIEVESVRGRIFVLFVCEIGKTGLT